MKARAPGKLVLSGAYAVLEGAPAIVAAADRYVTADSSRSAEFVTPEVRAALPAGPWPAFDASPLREGERKLGLGSSAAILVASLAALELDRDPELATEELAERVFGPALVAHREAQGGGSGIDVAASTHGGILLVRRASESLDCRPVRLPAGLRIHVLSEPRPASTQSFIARVRALAHERPAEHRACLGKQAEASERAARAVLDGDAEALLAALAAQGEALLALGQAAQVPIFTDALASLRSAAARAGAALLPSGAGGGDLALWVTREGVGETATTFPPEAPELRRLMLHLGAPGVARVPG